MSTVAVAADQRESSHRSIHNANNQMEDTRMTTEEKNNDRSKQEESRSMEGASDTDDQCYDMSDSDDAFTDPCCQVCCCCC